MVTSDLQSLTMRMFSCKLQLVGMCSEATIFLDEMKGLKVGKSCMQWGRVMTICQRWHWTWAPRRVSKRMIGSYSMHIISNCATLVHLWTSTDLRTDCRLHVDLGTLGVIYQG